jgi:hypothetical protein
MSTGSRLLLAVGLGCLGLLYALFLGMVTIGLSGGGHGWNSSLVSGLAGLVLLPAFGVAVALSGLRGGRVLLGGVVLLMLLADAWVAWLTWGERYYFDKVWQRGAEAVVFWAVLWFAWQVAALALFVLVRPGTAARRPAVPRPPDARALRA